MTNMGNMPKCEVVLRRVGVPLVLGTSSKLPPIITPLTEITKAYPLYVKM